MISFFIPFKVILLDLDFYRHLCPINKATSPEFQKLTLTFTDLQCVVKRCCPLGNAPLANVLVGDHHHVRPCLVNLTNASIRNLKPYEGVGGLACHRHDAAVKCHEFTCSYMHTYTYNMCVPYWHRHVLVWCSWNFKVGPCQRLQYSLWAQINTAGGWWVHFFMLLLNKIFWGTRNQSGFKFH